MPLSLNSTEHTPLIRPSPPLIYLTPPSQTEQFRLFPEPVWAVAAEAEFSQAVTSCQRLVEETDRVGEEGGGKFRSSSTATPTLLRRVNMQEAATHLLLRGLYFSMEFKLELPSFPPTAYSQPSIATRSWVLLEDNHTQWVRGRNTSWTHHQSITGQKEPGSDLKSSLM